MKKLNINCNGPDTIQDTIEIEDTLWNELERAIQEGREPKFYLVDDGIILSHSTNFYNISGDFLLI